MESDTLLEIGPFLTDLMKIALLVLTAIAGLATRMFFQKLGLEKNTALQNTVRDVIVRGGDLAMSWAQEQAIKDGKLTIDVKHRAIKEGAEFVLNAAPDALGHFGITRDGVINRLEAQWNLDLDGDGDIGVGIKQGQV